jgi:hypothetical protein
MRGGMNISRKLVHYFDHNRSRDKYDFGKFLSQVTFQNRLSLQDHCLDPLPHLRNPGSNPNHNVSLIRQLAASSLQVSRVKRLSDRGG